MNFPYQEHRKEEIKARIWPPEKFTWGMNLLDLVGSGFQMEKSL